MTSRARIPEPPKTRSHPADRVLFDAIAGLQRLADVFERRRQQLARGVGLSDGQWRVLEEVSSEHFMPSLFARSRDCSPAAVSRTLRQLQDKGLVSATIAAGDGRQRRYELTDAGGRVVEALREQRRQAIDRVWRDLDPTELRRFAGFSAELADRLEAYAAEDA